jgi:undecaprenyl phosphate-alpha-L-ara4N flippase subunit ArnF
MSRADISLAGLGHLATSIVASALAQLFMKAGMVALHDQQRDFSSLADFLPALLFTGAGAWVIGGLFCYGISIVAWLRVLSAYALSYAYPMLGISYILVYVGAVIWPRLAEPVSIPRTVGILLVVAGIMLVTGSRSDQR